MTMAFISQQRILVTPDGPKSFEQLEMQLSSLFGMHVRIENNVSLEMCLGEPAVIKLELSMAQLPTQKKQVKTSRTPGELLPELRKEKPMETRKEDRDILLNRVSKAINKDDRILFVNEQRDHLGPQGGISDVLTLYFRNADGKLTTGIISIYSDARTDSAAQAALSETEAAEKLEKKLEKRLAKRK